MKHLGLALGLFFALGSSGCIVVSDDGADLYESCFDSLDCNDGAAFCSSITVDWPDGIRSTNSICTWSCIDSSDCPFSNGDPGLCVDFSGSGFRCYEDCDFDSDCDPGFACGDVGGGFDVCLPR
ncbi:MAG: hypothetical protein H6724_13815 [Sandaracinus sp.]|nr:hypothetical protein [Sandaracinus sp.]MCB9625337.1 hypothetical protein [Sandaracinus sp.]